MNTDKQAVLAELDKRVHGHIKAKKALITAIERSKYRYYQKHVLGLDTEELVKPLNTLLVGKSGTGKTFLMRTLSEQMDFPLYVLDATQITPSGNSEGKNLKTITKELDQYARYLRDNYPTRYHSEEGAMSQIVVFVDEVDKLANSFESSGRWNAQVQANLLTLVDNGEYYEGLTFVFAGSFSALESSPKNRDIGFHSSKLKEDSDASTLTDEQIIKAGLLPELVGRIGMIVNLDKFTKEDFKNILNNKVLPSMERNFSHLNVEISEEEKDALAEKGLSSSQGVRFLTRSVNDMYLEAEFDSEYDYAGGPQQ